MYTHIYLSIYIYVPTLYIPVSIKGKNGNGAAVVAGARSICLCVFGLMELKLEHWLG